jgi:molybdopterin converting factor small subunit
MATVIVPALLRDLCEGSSKLELDGATLEQLLRAVDTRCPGFYDRVVEHGQMRPELALAMDGEILRLALHDAIAPNAEIAIVPAIGGG